MFSASLTTDTTDTLTTARILLTIPLMLFPGPTTMVLEERHIHVNVWAVTRICDKNLLELGFLTSTHNLCFGAKIRKIGISLHTLVLLYKSRVQGVYIARTGFPGESFFFLHVNMNLDYKTLFERVLCTYAFARNLPCNHIW